jgi:aspartyl protease/gag-polyprotein putative aspartyl protease
MRGIAACLALGILSASTLARADCKLTEIGEFHTLPGVKRPVVDGEINGKPVKVLIDISGQTFMPLYEAKQLGLDLVESGTHWYDGLTGVTQGYTSRIQVKIGGLQKRSLELPVTGDARTPFGFSLVLGDDFFSQVDTEFDLAHNTVRLFKPSDCKPPQLVYWGAPYAQADIMEWKRDTPSVVAVAFINGKKLSALLDSGDASSIVDRRTAEAFGVRWLSAAGPKLSSSGAESEDTRIGEFDSFALGDEKISHVRVLTALIEQYDWYHPRMWLGADFFRAHRIFIDVKDRLLLFSYAGGAVFDAEVARGN